jgi:hypothetical protein
MPDDAEGRAESVRRALDEFLGRLPRAVIDAIPRENTVPPDMKEVDTPPADAGAGG